MPNLCPICHKDDMIQKVSAVYQNGIVTTNYQQPVSVQVKGQTVYGSITQSATSRTDLAQNLRPPLRPKEPGSGSLGFVISGVVTIAAIIVVSKLFPSLNMGVVVIIGVIVAMLLLWIAIRPKYKFYKKQELPRWEKQISKWNGLYYCARDNCVYDPSTGIAVNVNHMSEILG